MQPHLNDPPKIFRIPPPIPAEGRQGMLPTAAALPSTARRPALTAGLPRAQRPLAQLGALLGDGVGGKRVATGELAQSVGPGGRGAYCSVSNSSAAATVSSSACVASASSRVVSGSAPRNRRASTTRASSTASLTQAPAAATAEPERPHPPRPRGSGSRRSTRPAKSRPLRNTVGKLIWRGSTRSTPSHAVEDGDHPRLDRVGLCGYI